MVTELTPVARLNQVNYLKKRIFRRIGIFVLLISLLAIILCLTGTNHTLRYIETLKPVGDNGLSYAVDVDTGYYCFTKSSDSDFKVLRLSDIHLGCGLLSIENDRKAVSTVYALVQESKPDLIIVTGDMIYPVPFSSGTINNYHQIKTFAALMERLEIPWTVTFGNHDTEVYSLGNREQISNYLLSMDTQYCIYQPGPDSIYGCGNSMIQVKNSDGSIHMVYVLLDSNDYVNGSITYDYDSIHEDQVQWYREQIESLAGLYTMGSTEQLPSIALWHIPSKEYSQAYSLYQQGDPAVTWMNIGENEEIDGYISSPTYPESDTIFDAIVELGSTKYVFVGHDHYNSFGIVYQGVHLCYGLAIDYLAYADWDPNFENATAFRGGTLITTNAESMVTVWQNRPFGEDSFYSS